MKTRLYSVLILAAALSATAFSAASKDTAPVGFPVEKLTQMNNEIERGTTQMTVRRLLGQAPRQLSANVWVYFGYHANLDLANEQGCDTMIITFADGKVADLKFVNARAVEVIAADLSRSPSVKNVASKK